MSGYDLSDSWPNLEAWEKDLILPEVRRIYIYTRSAVGRALERCSDPQLSSDATFETIWWIGAAEGYLFTVFGRAWIDYKSDKKWADLLNGHLWVRNQTLHDPLVVVPVTGHAVWPPGVPGHWAPRKHIPLSSPSKDVRHLGEAYDRALDGRVIPETLGEAHEVLRVEIRPDDIADSMSRPR